MEVLNKTVHLDEHEDTATGLPADFSVLNAKSYAEWLREERIPYLQAAVIEPQSGEDMPSQEEMVRRYRAHYAAPVVAGGLAVASDLNL